ncbi:hypothetical protein ACKWTF_015164 [Chironomus riparius]
MRINFVTIFIIFYCPALVNSAIKSQAVSSEELLVSTAISDICEEFFIKKSIKFDLIIYGEKTRHLDDVADGILRLVGHSGSTIVQHVKNINVWHHNLEDSALILFKSATNLAQFNSKASFTNRWPKLIKLLIYSENYEDFLKVKAVSYYISDKPDITSYEYFIIPKKFIITLMTFNHFKHNSCNKKEVELINFYYKTTQKWNKTFKNYKNFENLNSCMLTYTDSFGPTFHFNKENQAVSNCMKLSAPDSTCQRMLGTIFERPDVKFSGLAYEIFEAIGKRGNFTTNYQLKEDSGIYVKHKAMIDQSITIFLSVQNEGMLKYVHMTSTFLDIEIGIYVNPEEFYSNFEKLLLPFDDTIWTFLLFILLTTAFVIFVIRFRAFNLLYGLNITTPALNVARIICGTSQSRLPKQSIARFILITFVMFWLIIRTCYQSKMFDFITTDMRKPPPRTLDDVIHRGYTIVIRNDPVMMEPLERELMSISKSTKVLIVSDENHLTQLYCNSVLDPALKHAFLMPISNESPMSSTCSGSLIQVQNFHLNAIPAGLGMLRNSILYPLFDEVVEMLIPSGILQFLPEFYFYLLHGNNHWISVQRPRILNLDDLSFLFILWISSCGFSSIVFVAEIIRYFVIDKTVI